MRRWSSVGCALALTACGGPRVTWGQETPVRSSGSAAAPDEAFGETVRVSYLDVAHYGELIACDRDRLYVREHAHVDVWRAFTWHGDLRVDLLEAPRRGAMVGWTVAQTLSTGTHGFFALVTAPLSIVAGTVATASTWTPSHRVEACAAVRAHARFPNGMPVGFADRFDTERPRLRAPWNVSAEAP